MRSDYKRLGDYIREVDVRNRDLAVTNLLGVSVSKEFIPSIANTIGTDMSSYKVVRRGQFVYIADTSRRGDKIAIALLTDEKAIVSSIYTSFEVRDENELLPEYLMMWFRRPEFDRYARFKSHGSAREIFDWAEMCEVRLPIPSISRQRELVTRYETLTRRICLNETLITDLEVTAQTLYRHLFVDNIDPSHLPAGWRMGTLGEVAEYVEEKIALSDIEESTYISTENMLKDKRGIVPSENKPEEGRGTKFKIDDILVSNIRPYFKKIWKASFEGASSNDVLCFRAKQNFNSTILYYTLAQDTFFDYVMAGSNGVKMPRGDKEWIMKCPVIIPTKEILSRFEMTMNCIIKQQIAFDKEMKKIKEILSLLLITINK